MRQLLKLVIRNVGKGKTVPLSTMYDELESHLRSLETLGVTQEQSAAFLYPLVESSLPEDIVKVWQRSTLSGYDDEHSDHPVNERLKSLMKFLRREVKGAERLSYVNEGFGDATKDKAVKGDKSQSARAIPTAAGLFVGQKTNCVFCDKTHDSQICVAAQTMPYGLKKRKLIEKKACLICFKGAHVAKNCKAYVRCIICQKRHYTLMCPDVDMNRKRNEDENSKDEHTITAHTQVNCSNKVLLQTLQCVIRNGKKQRTVRLLLDPGSQKSYILETTARSLGVVPKGEVQLCHLLFGGVKDVQKHKMYQIEIEGMAKRPSMRLEVLSQKQICGGIPRMVKGPWMAELKKSGIFVSDLGADEGEIELLIGSDYYAKLLTGRKQCLRNGLVALETCLGWTLSGTLEEEEHTDATCSSLVTSMLVMNAAVSDLWDLEAIGIRDPVERKSRVDRELETKEHFLKTVERSSVGYRSCARQRTLSY